MISYTIKRDSYCVTLAEAKAWLSIDNTAYDTIIEDVLIPSAQSAIERAMGLSLSNESTVILKVDDFSADVEIELPIAPVQEIVSVTSDDVAIDYEYNGVDEYPVIITSGSNIEVEYKAGYAEVDAELKLAVLIQIAYFFQNRESSDIATAVKSIIMRRGRNLML